MTDALLECIFRNDVDQLMRIITPENASEEKEKKYKIKISDSFLLFPKSGLTLLHIAAYANSMECFIYLHSKCNFPLEIQSLDLKMPFHYAVNSGAADIVIYILHNYEARYGREKLIQDFFKKDYTNQEQKYGPTSCSIIFAAATSKQPQVLSALFKYGFDCTKFASKCKFKLQEALSTVVKARNVESLKILLKNIQPSTYKDEKSLLLAAIDYNQIEAIPLLLESGCDPNYVTPDNKTAMYRACFYSSVDAVRILAEAMYDVDIPSKTRAQAAVHWICQSKSIEIAKILCAKGIDVNRVDQDGNTGPFYIIDMDIPQEQTIGILQILLDHGLDINFHEKGKLTILGYFLTSINTTKNAKIIDFLLQNGADPNAEVFASGYMSNSNTKMTCKDKLRKIAKNDELKGVYKKYFGELETTPKK